MASLSGGEFVRGEMYGQSLPQGELTGMRLAT